MFQDENLFVRHKRHWQLRQHKNSTHCIFGSTPASGLFRNNSRLPGHVMAPAFTEEAVLKTFWKAWVDVRCMICSKKIFFIPWLCGHLFKRLLSSQTWYIPTPDLYLQKWLQCGETYDKLVSLLQREGFEPRRITLASCLKVAVWLPVVLLVVRDVEVEIVSSWNVNDENEVTIAKSDVQRK